MTWYHAAPRWRRLLSSLAHRNPGVALPIPAKRRDEYIAMTGSLSLIMMDDVTLCDREAAGRCTIVINDDYP
jgi:hypothetical protein